MLNLTMVKEVEKIYSGAIVRVYNVSRPDVMKNKDDYINESKRLKDFYDYMVVDCNVITKGLFVLVNVTLENDNRGTLFCAFENMTSERWLEAKVLKKYFGKKEEDVFIIN